MKYSPAEAALSSNQKLLRFLTVLHHNILFKQILGRQSEGQIQSLIALPSTLLNHQLECLLLKKPNPARFLQKFNTDMKASIEWNQLVLHFLPLDET
jgi:hypothetical protein